MKETPLLFRGDMVLSTLAGRKNMTRRVMKPQPLLLPNHLGGSSIFHEPCNYGGGGDHIWVKETWQYAGFTEDGYPFIRYKADGRVELIDEYPESWSERVMDTFAALSADKNFSIDNCAADRKWRPPIFMPRWASCIELEITDVKPQRLQEITAAECIDEGIEFSHGDHDFDAIERFIDLWDAIYAERGVGWDNNPYVWAITFRRVK